MMTIELIYLPFRAVNPLGEAICEAELTVGPGEGGAESDLYLPELWKTGKRLTWKDEVRLDSRNLKSFVQSLPNNHELLVGCEEEEVRGSQGARADGERHRRDGQEGLQHATAKGNNEDHLGFTTTMSTCVSCGAES